MQQREKTGKNAIVSCNKKLTSSRGEKRGPQTPLAHSAGTNKDKDPVQI